MTPSLSLGTLSPWEPGIFPLLAYVLLVLGLIGVFLFLASWLGEKKEEPEKRKPYESGIMPTGAARLLYPVPFYLVAAFFLIFDIEGPLSFPGQSPLIVLAGPGGCRSPFLYLSCCSA